MNSDHYLFPPMEEASEYAEDRDRENEVTLRFGSILALAVDLVVFVARLATERGASSAGLFNLGAASVVAVVAILYFVRTTVNLKVGRNSSHAVHSLFWIVVVAGGIAGYVAVLTDVRGFIAFGAAVFGAAVLFRAHWTFFLWLFSAAAAAVSALNLALASIAVATPLVVYSFVFALVAFVLAVKFERDHLRLFRVRKELAEKNAILEDLSFKDPLTLLFNRRYLVESLLHEMTVARRYNVPLSVGLVDVDLFKRVNDELGHPIGDSVLKELAVTMMGVVRDSDVVARYGGEEFIVIFTGSSLREAHAAGERMRFAAEQHSFRGVPWRITISMGVTDLRAEEGEEQLLKRVDELLYRAKSKGRNRVVAE